ncbi:hypothetical protein RhiJN_13045 [Ceratobasidium sp. AG-Ba]|nr:hypothetical protein RhiJN_13045 [Ceratobasidium sp. AG-Ba]
MLISATGSTSLSHSGEILLVTHSDADLTSSSQSYEGSPMASTRREPLPPSGGSNRGPLNPTRKNRFTILVIGETGSGKTAFVDLLINLISGNGPLELRGRTRGIEQDKIHKEEINHAIQKNITAIDAIVILANGTVERLGVATDYTFNTISSMFPYSIRENIGLILTNSDVLTTNFDPESLQPELRGSRRWMIQNPLALLKRYRQNINSLTNDELEQQEDQIRACYKGTVRALNNWLAWLDDRVVQPTIEIDRLYRISTDIESYMEAVLSTMARLSEQHTQLKEVVSNLHDATKAKAGLVALKAQLMEPVWEREPTAKYNTICITSGCYSNCHSPCNLNFTEDYTSLGRWCQVFKERWPIPSWDGALASCTVCKHPSKEHRHYKQVHVQTSRERDIEKLARQLESAETEEQQLQDAKDTAERRIIEVEQQMISAQDRIRALVDSYNEASLSRSFVGHIRSAIEMLKLRKEELKTKSNTDVELELVEDAIKQFESRLNVLSANTSGWGKRLRGLLESGRRHIPAESDHASFPGGHLPPGYEQY